jgi:ABC-type multidrug transport system fused ATPase/permease subunit
MVEPAEGALLIDGVDASEVPLPRLRRALCVVPQQPVLFAGSVRFNLDPSAGHVDDAAAWRALGLVRLAPVVRAMPGGLDAEVGDGGDQFSVGQRQLLCLARAVLHDSRVLVLDEATASTDAATDAQVQHMLRTTFRGRTIITVAHRLDTVADYDRILVLDQGRVAQYVPPSELGLAGASVEEAEASPPVEV